MSDEIREDQVEIAVRFLTKVEGTAPVGQMISFMKHKGLTDTEITEALNRATNGAVVDTAVGDLKDN